MEDHVRGRGRWVGEPILDKRLRLTKKAPQGSAGDGTRAVEVKEELKGKVSATLRKLLRYCIGREPICSGSSIWRPRCATCSRRDSTEDEQFVRREQKVEPGHLLNIVRIMFTLCKLVVKLSQYFSHSTFTQWKEGLQEW